MIIIGFDETFPLWALSAAEVGGLGWDTKRIGQVRTLAVTGRFCACLCCPREVVVHLLLPMAAGLEL